MIKVCGMRDADNIRAVEAMGIDWMGFICWPGSSRYVDNAPAYLPSRCERVGVFVDADNSLVLNKVEQLGLTRLQLHGHETPDRCRELAALTHLPVCKAISVRTVDDVEAAQRYETCVDMLLFDTKTPLVGGSGTQFDWSVLQHYSGTLPFLLAGGIGPDDAERVAAFSHPRFRGVDLNSRFETAPALKDVERLSTFIQEI